MFGKFLVDLLFVLALGSTLTYFLSLKNKPKLEQTGRYLYYALAGGMVALSAYMMYNILEHNFQFTYIWSYSSKNLPLHLLISTFYAGQEGSFLLWTLLLSLVGIFLLPYARKHGYEPIVMGSYSLIMVFLLFIIIIKSPFLYVWESFPGQNVANGFMPPEGRGLNPVLQNYWIAIHPPILFAGYAAMTVPFIFAIAGLIKKDFTGWIYVAIPWTLFAAAILGLGIMMGGFWAYETLGWGGFWAWDPVENSSLMPWLIAVALVHTMLVQKSTGGLVKTNFALAIVGFVLVLVATYLTRSGVLGESSVHSFVDPGTIVNIILLSFLGFFTLSGFGLLLFRMREFPKAKLSFLSSSKEMWLALGSVLLLALTAIVLIGTLRPVLPSFLISTKAALQPGDYNKWAVPLSILILVLNAVSIYMNWRQSKWQVIIKKLILPVSLSVVAVIVSFLFGANNLLYLFLGFTAWFSLFVNIELIIKNIKTNPKRIGAFVSHMGISALILGIISSGGYQTTHPLALYMNQSKNALGYKFTLIGKERIDLDKLDQEKYQYNIKIEKDGENLAEVNPLVYWSSFNNFEAPFFEPGIKRFISSDVYVSPKTFDMEKADSSPILIKGESCNVPYDTTVKMTFLRFDMSHINMENGGKEFHLGAVVTFRKDGKMWQDTLFAMMNMDKQTINPIPKDIAGTDFQANFSKLIPDDDMAKSKAEFSFSKEIFHVDVTLKPFINLVWFGVLAVVFGFVLSIGRHLNINKKEKLKTELKNLDNDNKIEIEENKEILQ